MLDIHSDIREKLAYFRDNQQIPNIIFHGVSGSGKSTIVNDFVNIIYDNDRDKIRDYVMYVNCAHGKGIKFIREELKFFAKTHINSNDGDIFKSVILYNADKLTMDAQSALRRCIELFNHTTRFFIVVEDKYKLLKPILSRFCEIYVPEPEINGTHVNLYKYNLQEVYQTRTNERTRLEWLKKELQKTLGRATVSIKESDLLDVVTKLYAKGYNGLDIIHLLESQAGIARISESRKYELLVAFGRIKKEFRNEKLLMCFMLNFLYLDTTTSVDNMAFI